MEELVDEALSKNAWADVNLSGFDQVQKVMR